MRNRNAEELANSITHALGCGLSIAALSLLVVRASLIGDAWQVVSVSLYGAALVALYLASTLYHSLKSTKAGDFLQLVDRSAIYLLIAGTYTPFLLISLRGGWGWSLFGVIWGLAFLGATMVSISVRKFPVLACILYVCMGWLIVIAIVPMLERLPVDGIVWLFAGGIAYTGGVLFFVSRKLFAHTLWHLAVLLGSTCHFFAVLTIVHA